MSNRVGVVITPQKTTVEFTLALPEMPDEITLNGELFRRVVPFPDLKDWNPFEGCIMVNCSVGVANGQTIVLPNSHSEPA